MLVFVGLTGFMLLHLFKAMINASLAVKIEQKPFQSFEELAASSFKVHVAGAGYIQGHLKNSAEQSGLSKVYHNNVLIHHRSVQEMLKAVANGSLPNSMAIGVEEQVNFNPLWPCHLDSLDMAVSKSTLGLIFQKGWPYTRLFNHHLLHLLESGKYQQLRQKYLAHNCRCPKEAYSPTSLSRVMTLIIVLIIGCIVSAVIFTFEYIYKLPQRKGQ